MGVLLSSKVCPKVKIFDFSADNVHQPDTNDMHTGATLDVGLLPESPFAQHSWSAEMEKRNKIAQTLVLDLKIAHKASNSRHIIIHAKTA